MTVQYDRNRCEAWLVRAKDLLSTKELAQLWMEIAFDIDSPTLNARGDKTLVFEWAQMSLWEKQAVLYMFAPVIERVVSHRAWLCSQEARKREPL